MVSFAPKEEEASADGDAGLYNFEKLGLKDTKNLTQEDLKNLFAAVEWFSADKRKELQKLLKLRTKVSKNKLTSNSSNLDSLFSLNSRIEKRLKEITGNFKKESDTGDEWAAAWRDIINISLGKPTEKTIKVFVDSGATHTRTEQRLCGKLRIIAPLIPITSHGQESR